jgi:hypothetical protein
MAGAAEALHESIHAPPSRAEQAVGRRFLHAARDQVGETSFDAARQHGRTLGLDGALTLALPEEPK